MQTYIVPEPMALGIALRAALHDSELERQGKRIVYFFDADVIAGCLFALENLLNGETESILQTRTEVRSLWIQGQLPRVRLTIPHLEELEGVLRAIEREGGIEAHLRNCRLSIQRRFGLDSPTGERLKRLLDGLAAGDHDDDRHIRNIVETLGILEFSVLEAEVGAHAIYRKGSLRNQIDLEGDLGEELCEIEDAEPRFQEVVSALTDFRGNVKSNRADAAALLALARLWARTASEGIEYRFYTQTDAIRDFCNHTTLGRLIASRPSLESPHARNVPCTDAVTSFIRSSAYFLLRVAFDSIGFASATDDGERAFLLDLADSLGVAKGQSTDPATPDSSTQILRSLIKYRDHSFTARILGKRRQVVIDSLTKLRSIKGIRQLQDTLDKHELAISSRLDLELVHVRRMIADNLSIRRLRRYLAHVTLPSPLESEASISRWASLFPTNASLQAAVSGLQTLCGDQPAATLWHRSAIASLYVTEPTRHPVSVVIPLLTVGSTVAAEEYLNRTVATDDNEMRLRIAAIRVWSYTLSATSLRFSEELSRLFGGFRACIAVAGPLSAQSAASRQLTGSWVAVYASMALVPMIIEGTTSGEHAAIIQCGLDWSRACMASKALDDHQRRMAWTALLLLHANEVLAFKVDPSRLSEETEACKSILPESKCDLYLRSAYRWAEYAMWQRRESRHASMQFAWTTEPTPALEPFQIACRDIIVRSDSLTADQH